MGKYRRDQARDYAIKYGVNPNTRYVYFPGDDCTNFISQCLRAGGAKNHYHPTHPWWYVNGDMSISWSVAGSLYWYIRVSSEEGAEGIRALTFFQDTSRPLRSEIKNVIKPADIIQYKDGSGLVRHSAIITGFQKVDGGKEPLITQHTSNQMNISWRKSFPTAIFHHIVGIN